MPRYNNRFKSAVFHEETIVDDDDKLIGRIRIKPSGVSWKPAHADQFYSVPLDKFVAWITSYKADANRTKS